MISVDFKVVENKGERLKKGMGKVWVCGGFVLWVNKYYDFVM